jgi:Cdc6-like AAA superfamily ATPase
VVDRETIKSVKGERVDGTCCWIEKDQGFVQWSTAETSSYLWINGGPGKGKTMLAVYLTERFEKTHTGSKRSTFFFFCDHREQQRNSASAILKGILHQIIRDHPELSEHAQSYMPLDSKSPSKEALWLMLLSILRDPKFGQATFVVDALDECDEDSIFWMSEKLASLTGEANNAKHRVLLISRSSLKISGQLVGLQRLISTTRIQLLEPTIS